jgi:hypothetical protein
METGPTNSALDRIEAALARIEAAAARPARTRSNDDGLKERHEALQSAVTQSLQQLDLLIGKQPI